MSKPVQVEQAYVFFCKRYALSSQQVNHKCFLFKKYVNTALQTLTTTIDTNCLPCAATSVSYLLLAICTKVFHSSLCKISAQVNKAIPHSLYWLEQIYKPKIIRGCHQTAFCSSFAGVL